MDQKSSTCVAFAVSAFILKIISRLLLGKPPWNKAWRTKSHNKNKNLPGRSAKLKQLGQNMESAAIIIIIIIINYFYHHRHHHHEKMKQRANFCVITQFLAHHFGLSCGKKSPLHAVVWCRSFWMVVRLNNSFRPLQQPAFAATISIVVPICAMECVWQKNAWWPAMEKCGLCSKTHDIEIVKCMGM